MNEPDNPEGVVLVVDSVCCLLGADSAAVCILGVISENACSTTLSLSADSKNNTLLILSKGWGKGYLGSKSTLELSSDPTADGRLVNLDRGSAALCQVYGPASC